MKNKDVPASYEEYVETIFRLSLKTREEPIKTSEIAKALEVKAPSVTEMLDKLKDKKLIFYEKRKGVTLTDKGKKIGEKLLKNHRIIEYFLYFILGIKDYHEIACQLEHYFNEEMSNKMLDLLGNPPINLEKDPIPDMINDKDKHPIIRKARIIKKINLSFEKINKIVKDKQELKLINAEKEKLIDSL